MELSNSPNYVSFDPVFFQPSGSNTSARLVCLSQSFDLGCHDSKGCHTQGLGQQEEDGLDKNGIEIG